jgi:nitroimidazol reductase NimA-like FMN-containing flavoprotein (pyridoxamine 5'-phosphate oxidase superfamily)
MEDDWMASWDEVAAAAPEIADKAKALFDAHRHKVLATLRKDGSPRISGIEANFRDGELWLGMMPGSRKALDLRRDPRLALHSATIDPPDDPAKFEGDAKLSGRAEEITDPARIQAVTTAEGQETGEQQPEPGSFHLFRVDVSEVVLTRIGDPPDHLVIELWREGEDVRRMRRK